MKIATPKTFNVNLTGILKGIPPEVLRAEAERIRQQAKNGYSGPTVKTLPVGAVILFPDLMETEPDQTVQLDMPDGRRFIASFPANDQAIPALDPAVILKWELWTGVKLRNGENQFWFSEAVGDYLNEIVQFKSPTPPSFHDWLSAQSWADRVEAAGPAAVAAPIAISSNRPKVQKHWPDLSVFIDIREDAIEVTESGRAPRRETKDSWCLSPANWELLCKFSMRNGDLASMNHSEADQQAARRFRQAVSRLGKALKAHFPEYGGNPILQYKTRFRIGMAKSAELERLIKEQAYDAIH